ncbi:MAG TPA: site-specific DNA-methyltransferase [Fimbriimonadaceae bacterium]|nr:site-specific DNA-methyltransferase [Fimbriimonadaceae bacterium]
MTQRLELTWVGKEIRPKLEPRILLEDPEKSYHADRRVSENDVFDNRLIFGDNLIALKALEQEFAGKVKCVFIDPPYNTGSAFEHYDDGVEHSVWLSLMRDRLVLIRELMCDSGSVWATLDDNEAHYFKVMADEVFGRHNFVANLVWRSTDNSNNDAKQFSVDHNHLFVYSKSPDWRTNRIARKEAQKAHYSNPDNDPRGPWFDGNPISSPAYRENLCYDLEAPDGSWIKPPKNGWRWGKETMAERISSGEIRFTPDNTGIRRRTYLADQQDLPPSSLWADLEETGHNRQAKYEQKGLFPTWSKEEWFGTPKPEKLLQKILHIACDDGDLVLDSFAGSGTTGAVAHKMGRRWIMVELGEHCHTHIIPRLRKVIDGDDAGGITKAVGWKGGGGFRYYRLAPSLIATDKYGNEIINPEFNREMLAEAVCKLEGFTYAPSEEVYWQHGKSTDTDFVYVTTQTLTHEQLAAISEEVGDVQTLLICCAAFRGNPDVLPNLTVKKIPRAVLHKCQWDWNEYEARVKKLGYKADRFGGLFAAPETEEAE